MIASAHGFAIRDYQNDKRLKMVSGISLDGGHDVAPDFRSVEDVRGAAFQGAYDVVGNLLGIGKARGVGHVIGHGGLYRSRLDGDDADASGIEAAAQSLKEEGETTFGGTIDIVGAASSISGDGGDGGEASGAAAF